ncbi:MAG: hypothetical protein ACRET2_11050, partial [Steroidobacteraceae bacterium]
LEHIDGQKRHLDAQQRHLEALEGREENRRAALARLAKAEAELAVLLGRDAEFEEAQRELAAVRMRAAADSEELRQLRTIAGSRSWRITAPLRRLAAQARRRG